MFQSSVVKAAFLLLACWQVLPARSQSLLPPKVQVEPFSVEQGLSDRDVNNIFKDKQGFLWISTEKGLNRFDGYQFLTYDNRPRNPHHIRHSKHAVFPDKAGNLLISYYDYYNANSEDLDLLHSLTGRLIPVTFEPAPPGVQGKLRRCLAADGTIYFLFSLNDQVVIYRFEESRQVFVKVFEGSPPAKGMHPAYFQRTSDGTYWFVYSDMTIIQADTTGHVLRSFRKKDFSTDRESGPNWVSLLETTGGRIWLSWKDHGVFILDAPQATVFKRYPLLPATGYYNLSRDRAGNLLLYQNRPTHPGKDCFLLTTGGQLLNYSWLFKYQNVIDQVFSEDFTLGLFAGSNNGFNKYQIQPTRFKTYLAHDLDKAPSGISIRGMTRVRDQLFIATETRGLYELDLKTNQLARPGDRSPQLTLLNQVRYPRNLLATGDSVLWMSVSGGIVKYSPARSAATFYPTFAHEVWSIAPGKEGAMWVAQRDDQVMKLDPASGVLTRNGQPYIPQPLKDNDGASMSFSARNGTIWIGSNGAGLFRFDPVKGQHRRFTANVEDSSGLSSNQIPCIYEDEAGLLWLGTLEGGLQVFDPAKGRVITTYTRENGLAHNSVIGILPAGHGNYWLSTFNGLSFFDAHLKTFQNYTTADGLSYNEFNRYSYFYDSEAGRYYFGGLNGVNAFDRNDLLPMENHAPLLISEISYAARGDSILLRQEGIVDGTTITLPPANPFLHLHLALADYGNPSGNQFAYKLEGFDKDWNYLGTNRDLRLDHLPVGSYILRLRGGDNRGNWSSREIALRVVVQEFWYRRWWAWMLYAGALALGGFYFYRFLLLRKIDQKEAQRLLELDAFKNRFFTNITHEFRTPLTVILGTTEQLKRDGEGWKEETRQSRLKLIKRNGESLLRLINQILDLAKLESNTLKMNYVQGDVLPYLRYITESLHSFADAQNVLLRMETTETALIMDYDPERLLQIVYNLLSNAIKFTPGGGTVTLRAGVDVGQRTMDNGLVSNVQRPTSILLSVADNGTGIPPEDLPYIFDRFYQANNLKKAKAGGTGIGLALTKELVEQMGGDIRVASEVNKGTIFTARWPINRNAPILNPQPHYAADLSLGSLPGRQQPGNGNQLLIIEDNPDVVEYLRTCLEGSYQIDVAYNGKAGVEKALETVPDLIISDVMMPEMDGLEVCATLKSDVRTSHIPIILLTARVALEDRIAGLRRGAEAYLAKPFVADELLAWVENLLRQRQRLRELLKQPESSDLTTPEMAETVAIEHSFLVDLRVLVEAKLSDPQFSVETLCREVGISHSQLHRKLIALTNESVQPFIQNVRLDIARQLLLGTDQKITDIAYEAGFSDPKYFSRVFARRFGTAPAEYRKRAHSAS